MKKGRILWVDDEIELLRAHILFLKARGFEVIPVNNGFDAVNVVATENIDLVLLDEIMAGKDGLTTLTEIKAKKPGLPVIMITKNEEESLMEQAIGRKITDYLTKPINPSQVLLACKKVLEQQRISSEHASRNYLEEFQNINQKLYSHLTAQDWIDIYQKLAYWELEFDDHPDLGLQETLEDQKRDCNIEFAKFIEEHYADWLREDVHFRPMLSPDILPSYIFPMLREGHKVLFIIIDCMRLDQWYTFAPMIYELFDVTVDHYFSILPSATPYARNSLLSGLFPAAIQKLYPDLWSNEQEEESSLNRYEPDLLARLVQNFDFGRNIEHTYFKILDANTGWQVERKIASYLNQNLIALVVNFVDVLAHQRSDSDFLKEILPNEASYRSLVRTWFKHSWLYAVLRRFAEQNFTIVLTSDHGSIRVQNDVKVVGDKTTSPNIRFKVGKNLNTAPKYSLVIKDPEKYLLPSIGINTNYLIAKENFYFVYPTNYHKFQAYFKDTFQHGGISMEEMIIPLVKMTPRQ